MSMGGTETTRSWRRRALALCVLLAAFCSAPTRIAVARESRLPERPLAEAVKGVFPPPGLDAFLGVVTQPAVDGLLVARVVDDSAAARGGVRPGDILQAAGGRALTTQADLDGVLRTHSPGDGLRVSMVRAGAPVDRQVVLGGRRSPDPLYRGALFRLCVVPVAFAGEPAPREDPGTLLRRFFFAHTGLRGPGASVADYFAEQSAGALRVEGRLAAPVQLAFSRAHYAAQAMGGGRGSLFAEAADTLATREGSAALQDTDGLVFLYAGETDNRPGSGLWPHRSVVQIADRRLPYYVHSLATVGQGAIGEHCHEFGHLLGLPDSYGTGHRTGPGDFCLMAIGHRGGGADGAASPFSLCAWCRMRLGWLPTVTVDPAVAQRVVVPPSVGRGGLALIVPLDRRSHEFLLVEARARAGFDRALPSAGLLVWHVGGRPSPGQGRYGADVDLVEAHGIDTFDASLVHTAEIAFPTVRARDLTPETIPASGGPRLTDMRRLPDGSVAVTIGVSRHVVQETPVPYDDDRPGPDGTVARLDPVTGELVHFIVDPRGGGETTGRGSGGAGGSRR